MREETDSDGPLAAADIRTEESVARSSISNQLDARKAPTTSSPIATRGKRP
jgi:hypothetical protein